MALSEKMKDRIEMAAAALLIGAAVAGSGAMAQRDPAYQAARAEGLVGRKKPTAILALSRHLRPQ